MRGDELFADLRLCPLREFVQINVSKMIRKDMFLLRIIGLN
jgi:hypothetical protein